MNKTVLRKKINNLLDGIPEDVDDITIYYVNPFTQEKTLLYQSPAAKGLQVEVDDPATAETFNKLRNHEQNTPEATDR
jgi:DNA-binding beta-propeller fold protein YncE